MKTIEENLEVGYTELVSGTRQMKIVDANTSIDTKFFTATVESTTKEVSTLAQRVDHVFSNTFDSTIGLGEQKSVNLKYCFDDEVTIDEVVTLTKISIPNRFSSWALTTESGYTIPLKDRLLIPNKIYRERNDLNLIVPMFIMKINGIESNGSGEIAFEESLEAVEREIICL